VELLAAATETVTPIVSALAWAQEPSLLAQIHPAAERSSLRRAAPGKISGTVAKLRRLLFRLPLRLATARHTVSWRFDFRWPSSWSELEQEQGPAAATERGSQSEAGRELTWEQLSQLQSQAALGIGLKTEARSRHSFFPPISRPAIARRIASLRFQRA
jgi:hypothetical protein